MRKLLVVVMVISLVIVGIAGCTKKPAQEEQKQFTIGINNFGQANFFARIGRDSMMDQI